MDPLGLVLELPFIEMKGVGLHKTDGAGGGRRGFWSSHELPLCGTTPRLFFSPSVFGAQLAQKGSGGPLGSSQLRQVLAALSPEELTQSLEGVRAAPPTLSCLSSWQRARENCRREVQAIVDRCRGGWRPRKRGGGRRVGPWGAFWAGPMGGRNRFGW